MGVWGFLKNTGKELSGGSAGPAGAEAIRKEMKGLGLDMTGPDLKVRGDTTVINGKARGPENQGRGRAGGRQPAGCGQDPDRHRRGCEAPSSTPSKRAMRCRPSPGRPLGMPTAATRSSGRTGSCSPRRARSIRGRRCASRAPDTPENQTRRRGRIPWRAFFLPRGAAAPLPPPRQGRIVIRV